MRFSFLLSLLEASWATNGNRDPLSTLDPSTLFDAVERQGTSKPGKAYGNVSGPKPTNSWWSNIALASPSSLASNVFQMPYVVMAQESGLLAMQPFFIGAGMQDFNPSLGLTLTTSEPLPGPLVHDWDDLSVTVLWGSADAGSASMRTPLVRGSPYVTAEYRGAIPKVSATSQMASNFIVVDGVSAACDATTVLRGSVFSVQFADGDATWQLFAPKDSSWVCQSSPFSLTATAALDGAVRVALANACTTGNGNRLHHCKDSGATNASDWEALLRAHAGRYPVKASIGIEVSGDDGKVSWAWTSETLTGWDDSQPLLQLAYPVHVPLLSQTVSPVSSPFQDLRGPTVPVLADSWDLTYNLFPDVGFAAPRAVPDDAKAGILHALRVDGQFNSTGHLRGDKEYDIPLNYQLGAGDTYFSAKMIARLARLVSIADELGESDQSYFETLLTKLKARVEVWLDPNTTANPFLYDRAWGGVVACGCDYDDCGGTCTPHCANPTSPPESCPALGNPGQNFGNAFYNDHHFHYGYFVFSAAVAAKHDPAWEQKWREPLLALIRDYGNPSPKDPHFPVARHKDWFLGSSWAGGIADAFVNGKNQESTSEAVNGYYALYLYGVAVEGSAPFAQSLRDVGRVLTAMEAHSADVFWHVRPDSPVYSTQPYTYNHVVVGMMWTHMLEFQTYFGTTPYFIHGIQQMPYTPVTESYLPADWVALAFPEFEESCHQDTHCDSYGWSWLVCLEQAILDTTKASQCMAALPADPFTTNSAGADGNSLTNALHWIATRPSYVPAPPPTPTPPTPPTPVPPPSPAPACSVGDAVDCPGSSMQCAGNECCIDGSTCPSAYKDFSGCPKAKSEDCTGSQGPWELLI